MGSTSIRSALFTLHTAAQDAWLVGLCSWDVVLTTSQALDDYDRAVARRMLRDCC
jgi:hypothetical protein